MRVRDRPAGCGEAPGGSRGPISVARWQPVQRSAGAVSAVAGFGRLGRFSLERHRCPLISPAGILNGDGISRIGTTAEHRPRFRFSRWPSLRAATARWKTRSCCTPRTGGGGNRYSPQFGPAAALDVMDGAWDLALRDPRLAPSGVPVFPLVVAPSSDSARENSVLLHSGARCPLPTPYVAGARWTRALGGRGRSVDAGSPSSNGLR